MEQEKPFKTIEVVDSRTNQVCKVACMSCIRGHRTTSCGIPVCRTKIFWTVKRPGRPSNSCTCRYGATGGCKCVVARSSCPHKSKKGEKRSGECRCDEQGRYCCLLEPGHWNALMVLDKPTVDFYPSRKALESSQMASTPMLHPSTPSYSTMSPESTATLRSISVPPGQGLHTSLLPQPFSPPMNRINSIDGYSAPLPPVVPRFGMMGVVAPMGPRSGPQSDLLAWEGEAPTALRDLNALRMQEAGQAETSGCCCAPTNPSVRDVVSPIPTTTMAMDNISLHGLQDFPMPSIPTDHPYDSMPVTAVMSPILPPASASIVPAFDFERLQHDYSNYQFPSAICQNCGLNGCTCRNCPPVFQNPGTTSWAQGCGRKHARDVAQPAPRQAAQKLARTGSYNPEQGVRAHDNGSLQAAPAMEQPLPYNNSSVPMTNDGDLSMLNGYLALDLDAAGAAGTYTTYDDPFLLTSNDEFEKTISELLASDLDRSGQVDPGGGAGGVEEEAQIGAGGRGGCCCGD